MPVHIIPAMAETVPILPPLLAATVMVIITVLVHFAGLTVLMMILKRYALRLHRRHNVIGQALVIIGVVLSLFFIHGIEIWTYAGVYVVLNALPTFEAALYFSTTSFSTLGYGDVTIDNHWRLLAAIEGINGFILIGWSTAFFVSLMQQMRVLEADLDR